MASIEWLRSCRDGGRFIRIAHRGASGSAPENTHAAFAAALDLGVDMIEIDCQLSSDGELVVIHDEILDRTTSGSGPVATSPWSLLATLDAGAWRGGAFQGERVPRLADVLVQLAGRAALNVEIKSAHDVGAIEPRLAATITAHGAADWVVFSSFHAAAVRNLRVAAPWAHIGILWDQVATADALALAAEVAARCLIPNQRYVDAALVEEAHARGLGVWVWTVNEPAEMRRLLALGVDGLFSDYPERFAMVGTSA